MTYTFKLARRLAVSRTLSMLPVILVVAACSGSDATAPQGSPAELPESGIYGWRPRESTPVAVRINPSSLTIETNQLIQFRARGRNRAGDEVGTLVAWSATGGTILPDGRFTAATTGTYQVFGRTRTRDDIDLVDSSTITVVRRQPGLTAVEILPDTATLSPGGSRTFSAIGRVRSGAAVPIGVNWRATGGTIDVAGTYVAGDTAGTYLVIAANTVGTLADTAIITIAPPPSVPDSQPTPPTIPLEPPAPPPADTVSPPPTEPPPPPPPAPVMVKLILKPWSTTLAPGASIRFWAFGRTAEGDSIGVNILFEARGGGTITQSGLYTAGRDPGKFLVIASAEGLADTSSVTITQPLGSGSSGIPFAIYQPGSSTSTPPTPFNLGIQYTDPGMILSQLSLARSNGHRLLLAMTGGGHDRYITNGRFDFSKWKAVQRGFDTPAIRQAVAEAVASGTLVATVLLDEPQHVSWGGVFGERLPVGASAAGIALLDSMASFTKSIFPTLPTSIATTWLWLENAPSFQSLDMFYSQFDWWQGNRLAPDRPDTVGVRLWRDGAAAVARRMNVGLLLGLNILDGGVQDWVTRTCPIPETGGPGTDYPERNVCRVSAAQLRDWTSVLIRSPDVCAVGFWRYDATMLGLPEYQDATRAVALLASQHPAISCKRS